VVSEGPRIPRRGPKDHGDRSTSAERDGDGWVLSGPKTVVLDAPLATHQLITAQAPEGMSLFLTEFDATSPPPGMTVHCFRTIDDRRAADLVLDNIRLPTGALLGEAEPSLARAHDEGARSGVFRGCRLHVKSVGRHRRIHQTALAIGHYFKRLTAMQYEFGSTDHHLSRYAALTRPSR
jgi:alkylation response protein AidB-like acyl-CoA dehydrogenase